MREILFRGKTKGTIAWIEGYYFKADNRRWDRSRQTEDWIAATAVQNGGRCDIPVKYAVIPETVGQYTGLNDRNGRKIFEGDVIKDDWGKIFKVIFTTTSCGFMVECTVAPNEYEKGKYRLGDAWCDTIAVIGNIHDNPELLPDNN